MSNITDIIITLIKEIGEEQENAELQNATEGTLLFGRNLDSMGVVFLVADLEAAISDELNFDLTLADERAMSQKTSPFRSVKTLAEYVTLLLSEQQE